MSGRPLVLKLEQEAHSSSQAGAQTDRAASLVLVARHLSAWAQYVRSFTENVVNRMATLLQTGVLVGVIAFT
eukprot:15045246-Alexandrium_andersonii.AAC.1